MSAVTGGKTVFSGQLELAEGSEPPPRPLTAAGRPFSDARLLIRNGGEPLGFVELAIGEEPLTRGRVLAAVRDELGTAWERQAGALAASTRDAPTPVTVAVCTRNRAHLLPACLESLQSLDHRPLEFVVVDNAPADGSTKEVVESFAVDDPRFRYCLEPRPGLSRGRNRAIAEASGEVIAFTDDDVRVDPLWVRALLRGFGRRADVGCVTGMVASASLELPAEQYFDGRVWWSSKCEPQIYDASHGPAGAALHPYAAGAMGTGANFAMRADLIGELGGFDECLGAGSPSAGGEDLDAFVRVIRAGRAIAYEPAALVWHVHRIDADALRAQMYEYGTALSAYLFKYVSSPRSAWDILRRAPQGFARLGVLGARSQRVGEETGFHRELLIAETKGLIAGPWTYLKARRSQPRARRRAVAP